MYAIFIYMSPGFPRPAGASIWRPPPEALASAYLKFADQKTFKLQRPLKLCVRLLKASTPVFPACGDWLLQRT